MATWQEVAADKKKRQQESIPKEWLIDVSKYTDLSDVTGVPAECGLLSSFELEITETTDVDVLLQKLAIGQWSSVDVTRAFYKRAIVAHQLTNCLTEIFVERALVRAAEVDEYLKTTGKPMGPLHGLPISLKDQLRMKGLETVMGYVSWVGKYSTYDAVLVQILYEAGAVPFVRTNVPQTLMWPETFNHVFGRTTNPFNRSLASGGSSGGEGALVGMKGSPIGIGSDIGGSIRIPSAFNGLYGLRPSYGRVPYSGAANSLEGQDSVHSVLGPLTNSLSGIKNFLKAVAAGRPWTRDPLAARKPWREDEYNLCDHGEGKDLVFAIKWDNGEIIPHPPLTRALEMTKAALVKAGHKVIDWVPYKDAEICTLLNDIFSAGATEDYKKVCAGTNEPLITTMRPTASNDTTQDKFFEGKALSAYELWQKQKRKLDLRKESLDHWNATVNQTGTGRPVDAVISPCAPFVATPHGTNRNAQYTMVWNGLDYAACVFPVTRVDPVLDQKKAVQDYKNPGDQANYEMYDPAIFKNAPVCLQLVGQTLEEEAVIRMTEIVDAALKAHQAQ